MPDKKDPAEKIDAQVAAAREADLAALDDGPNADLNEGGFRQVEGHGWTDAEIKEREQAVADEEKAAKLRDAAARDEREARLAALLDDPRPHKETAFEKKQREISENVDRQVEAARGGAALMTTGPASTLVPGDVVGTHTMKQPKAIEDTRGKIVMGVNDDAPYDPSTPVIKHPDRPSVGPSDKPPDMIHRTGSASNLLPRGAAQQDLGDTGPTVKDLAANPLKNEPVDVEDTQDNTPSPVISKKVLAARAPRIEVAPDEPSAKDSGTKIAQEGAKKSK